MPLNKNLGLRLIGVGAVLRMILEKIVMMISKQNVVKASGSLEFCAEAGAESSDTRSSQHIQRSYYRSCFTNRH